MELYDLTLNDRSIGQVQLSYSGLYCVVKCKCRKPGSEKYRLYVRCNEVVYNLGLYIPEADNNGAIYRFPVKQKEGNHFLFYAEPVSKLIAVSESAPFPHIWKLNGAVAVKGKDGIMLRL